MSKVKLDLQSMTLPEKIQFGRNLAFTLDAHFATFPTPPWDEGDLLDLCDDVQAKYNAAQAIKAQAKSLTTTQDDAEAALNLALTQEANYVQNVSGGNPAIIGLSGLSIKAASSPIGLLHAPIGLVLSSGNAAGRIDLKWRSVKKSKTYIVQSTTTPGNEASWENILNPTKAKGSVGGLASGTRYYFRVAALNAAGLSEWSDAVGKIAE